jgi:photosystem II stability/assembly factor-like uncharacterized protein
MSGFSPRVLSTLVLATAIPLAPGHADGIDPSLLAGLKARAIGPATMSGRIADIAVAPSDPKTIYVGTATGGVWKSSDGGLTFAPIFDDQPVAAIGALAVSPASADVLWVGTGEGNPRNSASVGNGVYLTRDGGKTWEHLGLVDSERIHRILLHPEDPLVAYVGALGKAWGESEERGVFRTADGGKSWQKVLYVNDTTGTADLVMDPENPDKLFAALWDYRRWPWTFRSGGPGSGLYVTHDGGRHWTRLDEEDGLPPGELGRIGLAVAPSDPDRVYALVEDQQEIALYRSDDGGDRFEKVSTDPLVGNRPFYYADIRVDTRDPNRVYSLWSAVSLSRDGGKTWENLVGFGAAHPDHHALWIDPRDPHHLWGGNDGGVYESRDRGHSWRFVANLPVGQYYHVRVDEEVPYNVYGGMQDNGSWRGPSTVWENGGIRNHHWQEVGFGDGFDTLPIPGDSRRGFAMSQEGYLIRWDLDTGERKDVRPPAPAGPDGLPTEELRFNWNAGLAIDPFEPRTIYYGSQFVHRSRDLGETWEVVSPDLTTDNPDWQKQGESGGLTLDVTGAENFTTIVAIAPSPVAQGVIWVGTDDGRLHLTRNGGESWESLEGNLRGVPAHTWIPHVAPSPHDAATAFVVFDDHRRSNWTPYVYKTTDYGKTWKSLVTQDLSGYALVIAQDPVDPELLFLGTEFGLWVSFDGGGKWIKWTHGVPTVSVMDLVIHPRDHDLVLGTHGRAAFVLDDLAPLRELSAQVQAEPLHLFPIAPAQQYRVAQTGSSRFPGQGEFRGENRPYGALLTVSLADPELPHPDEDRRRAEKEEKAKKTATKKPGKTAEKEGEGEPADEAAGDRERKPKVKVEVKDSSGAVLRRFEREVKRGVNRIAWDLRRDAFKEPPRPDRQPRFFEPAGPEVLPGTYTVTVRYKDHEATGQVQVLADPRFDLSPADRAAGEAALLEAGALQEVLATGIIRIVETRQDVDTILAKAKRGNDEAEKEGRDKPHEELVKAAGKLKKGLDEVERRLWNPPGTKGIPPDDHAWSKVSYAQRSLGSSWDPPTAAQKAALAIARATTREALAELDRFFTEEVVPFRQQVAESGLGLFVEEPAGGGP